MSSRIAAEALTKRGFSVFPLKAGAKTPPLWKDWPNRSCTTIPDDWPIIANVGIHCVGMIVVDIDPRNGGFESLVTLELDTPLPATLETITPRGGRHLFFRLPAGHPGVQNRAHALGRGIDVKSTNGYVVGAGSRTDAGEYRFIDPAAEIADAPGWLVAQLGVATIEQAAVPEYIPDADQATLDRAASWLKTREPAIEGCGGDAHTFATAAMLRDYGLSEQQTWELMCGDWNEACMPPWEHGELADKVAHAYAYAKNPPGSKALTADDFPMIAPVVEEPAKAPAKSGLISLADLTSRPLNGAGYVVKGLLQRQEYAMIYGAPGEGKAQPLDEPVLTPDGWRPMGSIKPGGYVIGSAGVPVQVLGTYPQGEKAEWEVEFENGTVVRCCGDHLWTVFKTGAAARTITTAELAQKPHKTRWHVPLVRPVNYTPSGNPLPVDPYLLGALLGDGGITHYVGFSSADSEIVSEISARLPRGHSISKKPGNNGYDYQITSPRGQPNQVWNALRLLGLAGKTSPDKFIPTEFATASPAERLLLLQGLMDTDGWSQGGRLTLFASSSRRLTEQVRDLVGSLGGVANLIRTKQTSGLDSHLFSFSLPAGMSAFRLRRKLERVSAGRGSNLAVVAVRPTGRTVPMQCIRVASLDNLYVTTGYVLTHNTFAALDIAYHVAAGKPWMGRKVHQGTVLYVGFEAYGGLASRALALKQHYGDTGVPLYFAPGGFNLRELAGRQALGALMASLPKPPSLIVFDTFAYALAGGDENAAKDVSAFNEAVQALIAQTGACVLVIHHTGKDASRGARGSSALAAALDTELEIADNEIRPVKQRNVEMGDSLGFKLQPLAIGYDDDGDLVSSCVVIPMQVMSDKDKVQLPKPGSMQRRVWDVLCEARKDNSPISETDLRQLCNSFLPGSDTAARKQLYDAIQGLKHAGLVVLNDGYLTRKIE